MNHNLTPQKVFDIFFKLCKIPHGSGNTQGIADFCVDYAVNLGLPYKRDKYNNVVIYKAGKGEPLCLQAHTDMVCEKTEGNDIDFRVDPIIPEIVGDEMRAKGTTLGADNGIGVAMCLALLEEETQIPLEIVLTSDEEIGLVGAAAIDRSWITARRLINLDSEEEGIITVGCANGITSGIKMPIELSPQEGEFITLTVSGLAGGHSGVDIDKGRLNGVKLLFSIISRIGDVKIAEIHGGTRDSAIPRTASAKFLMNCDTAVLDNAIAEVLAEARKTEATAAAGYTVSHEALAIASCTDSGRIVNILNKFPSGVITMSSHIEGMVESSLNLSIIGLDKGFYAESMVRSSNNAASDSICETVGGIAKEYGAESYREFLFPAWEYLENSQLQAVAENSYYELFGKKAQVQLIHAGLECGVLGEGIDGLESISIGPDMWDVHTTEETLSISSTKRTWDYILKIISDLANSKQ